MSDNIQVFGGMGVHDADGPVSIGGLRQRRLLALLVIKSGSIVDIDWLAEHLWDDDDRPTPTEPALRTTVSRLRRALPADAQDWITTEPSGYRFTGPPESVEHNRFSTLRARARQARDHADPAKAQQLLDEALGLWRGEPFRELEDLDWARADIEQLRLDRLEMMEERWEAVLDLGRHTQITGELAAFTAEHEFRERAARQYALALHRSSRTAEALQVIEGFRRTLADQSGLDPSPEMSELEAALLRGDTTLDVEKTGRPLRGYRLIEEIGSGAFSIVWRGMQPSVNREVAIKQIRPELASRPDFIRRFEAEAQVVARIDHPHIVPMIDFWRDPDSAYLVMHWLRGGTLEQRLDAGQLSLDSTRTLAHQIGGALTAAHHANIVHRDVKTSNIMFDEAGHAFLTDFGIALEIAHSGGPEAALSQGSPAYASPEQIRRETLDARADIFSLGVVLFECLAGTLPFRDNTSVQELVERQLVEPYPLLSEWRSELPNSVIYAVATATAKDPSDRFASIADFLRALDSGDTDDATLATRSRTVSSDVANPYRGLRAFDETDADNFFGRESLVSELVDRLAGSGVESRCLVVVGPSGSGKSSLVRAGLVPSLRVNAVPSSADWFHTVMVPGTDAFESLEAALLRVAVNPPSTLVDQLRDGKRGILRGVRRCLGNDDDRVVVIIDQFEELFTAGSKDDADRFLDALSVAVQDPASPVRLILTLRADYYDRPLEHHSFAPILKAAAVDVTPLAGDELELAIVEPARRVGVHFESGLVPRIAAEALGQPSPLPLLQYTLSELFDRRDDAQLTLDAFAQIGGITGALASRAEGLYTDADDAERAAARTVFGRMTLPGHHSTDIRRRVERADLATDDATRAVLDKYGAARLITFDRDPATREPTVEVAHEALLREWPRLLGWLNEDRELLRSADAIAQAATFWDQSGRERSDLYRAGRLEMANELALSNPERLRQLDHEFIEASRVAASDEQQQEHTRVTRLRRLVGVVGVALVVSLIAGGLALRQQDKAEAAAAEAETQARLAQQQAEAAAEAASQAELATLISRSAALAHDEPAVSVLLALEAHERSPTPETEQAILNALSGNALGQRVATFERFPAVNESGFPGWLSRDGLSLSVSTEDLMMRRSLETGEIVEVGRLPELEARWIGDEESGRRVAQSLDLSTIWLGRDDEEWVVEIELAQPMQLIGSRIGTPQAGAMFAANRLPYATIDGTYIGDGNFEVRGEHLQTLVLLDAKTGDTVGPGIEGLSGPQVAFSADARLIAVRSYASSAFGDSGASPGGGSTADGRVFVIDAETGAELQRFDVPGGNGLVFDPSGRELLLGAGTKLITIDLETEEVGLEVATSMTSDIVSVDLRPDGRVVVVSNGLAEMVNRRDGPTADGSIQLRNAVVGAMRSDDTLLITTSDGRLDIYDFDGSALADQVVDVPSGTDVLLGFGNEAILDRRGSYERLDLITGDSRNERSMTSRGEAFIPYLLEADGVLSFSLETWEGARFVNGEVVNRMNIFTDPDAYGIYGASSPDQNALMGQRPDGTYEVSLVDTDEGELALVNNIAEPDDACSTYPAPNNGIYVMLCSGLLRTYDSAGAVIAEVETGLINTLVARGDPTSGRIAFGSPDLRSGLAIIDPAKEVVQILPDTNLVVNLTFARDGKFLAILDADGTLRLWDVERRLMIGAIWDGIGADIEEPLWYDTTTDSLWLSASGKLVRLPLSPQRWTARGCQMVGRDFTQEEWTKYVPGDAPLRSACS